MDHKFDTEWMNNKLGEGDNVPKENNYLALIRDITGGTVKKK